VAPAISDEAGLSTLKPSIITVNIFAFTKNGSERKTEMKKGLVRWRAVFGSGIFITLTVIGLESPAQAQSSKPLLNPANQHFYEAVTVSGGIGWLDARAAAASRSFRGVQGHLVTITSAQEDNFIIANLPEAFEAQPAVNECAGGPTTEPSNCGDPYWLGGFQPTGSPDNDPAGGWEWVTGEPFVYAPWAAGEPNDFDGRDEDCLHPHPNLTPGWNDSQCDDRRVGGYVVEYDKPNE